MKSKLDQHRMRLIERLGVHLEEKEQLAPLAARIISTLVLTGKKGVPFDEMVQNLGASKSTISTHLGTLQAVKRISYYTKPGDRKKYFIIPPEAQLRWIDEMVDKWTRERNIHQEILEYKKQCNQKLNHREDSKFELEIHKEYLKLLSQACATMVDLREKVKTA